MITINKNIDIVSGGIQPIIHLNQYDSDFSIVFTLYASTGTFTLESGTTAEIRGTKRDGNGYSANCTIDITNKKVTVTGNVQMTACAGRNVYELTLIKNSKELNTINFILDVEQAALDANTITDQSVLKELNAIIAGAAEATQAAEDANGAADRAEQALEESIPLTETARAALLACFEHVAWAVQNGQDYYNALETALTPNEYPKIIAEYNGRGHVVLVSDSLASLKDYLTVTYYEDISSSGTVLQSSQYTLSGTLSSGSTSVRVSYNNVSTTFAVNVLGLAVPNNYTRKDYLKIVDGSGDSASVPSAGWIRVATGQNLNALSYCLQACVESGHSGSTALFGGRSASGNTSSIAVYYNETSHGVAGHTHGTDSSWVLDNSISNGQVADIALINGSASPSEISVNGQTANIAWANTNNISALLTYLSNPTPSDSSTYMHRHIRLGNFEIKDINGDTLKYLVPVVRNSDNVIGVYDCVSGTFYTASTASYATVGNTNCVYTTGLW